jgi:hypothetical protein
LPISIITWNRAVNWRVYDNYVNQAGPTVNLGLWSAPWSGASNPTDVGGMPIKRSGAYSSRHEVRPSRHPTPNPSPIPKVALPATGCPHHRSSPPPSPPCCSRRTPPASHLHSPDFTNTRSTKPTSWWPQSVTSPLSIPLGSPINSTWCLFQVYESVPIRSTPERS